MTTARRTLLLLLAAVSAALTTVAAASDHDRYRSARAAPATAGTTADLALYRKECGSCHVAFPPGLLRAETHRRLMAMLDRHFGQNAELESATRDRLESWLVANGAESGLDRRSRKVLASDPGGAAPLRLTEASWFQRKHRKIDQTVLARPSIGTFANCAACHGGAAGWDFDDDRVRIPAR
jgi:hypothetical protein